MIRHAVVRSIAVIITGSFLLFNMLAARPGHGWKDRYTNRLTRATEAIKRFDERISK